MKVIAINGSPRKTYNTGRLLQSALDGARSKGAEVELVNLIDLNFKGCISCFGCKKVHTRYINSCAYEDELTPVLKQVMQCDALILGSPIYVGDITSAMRAFLERLIFMNVSYIKDERTSFEGKIDTGFIYTMNVPLSQSDIFAPVYETGKRILGVLNGYHEYIIAADTYQFDDYGKYNASRFDEKHKAQIRDTKFPEDLKAAFNLGVKLASPL